MPSCPSERRPPSWKCSTARTTPFSASRWAHQIAITRAVLPPPRTPVHQPAPSTKIFVGGVPTFTSEGEFLSYFALFGRIKEYAFPANPLKAGHNKGFGFLNFASVSDAIRVAHCSQSHVIRAKAVTSPARRPLCQQQLGAGQPRGRALLASVPPVLSPSG